MALKPCKECKREISTDAKNCPHCGKSSPTRQVRSLRFGLIGVLILSVFAALNMSRSGSDPDPDAANAAVPTPREAQRARKRQALSQIKLDFTWRKGGFETAMIADFVITNPTEWPVKDLEVTCEYFGPSGTRIDTGVRTIYEIVEAKSTKRIKEFNMGFLRTQATRSSCSVTNVAID